MRMVKGETDERRWRGVGVQDLRTELATRPSRASYDARSEGSVLPHFGMVGRCLLLYHAHAIGVSPARDVGSHPYACASTLFSPNATTRAHGPTASPDALARPLDAICGARIARRSSRCTSPGSGRNDGQWAAAPVPAKSPSAASLTIPRSPPPSRRGRALADQLLHRSVTAELHREIDIGTSSCAAAQRTRPFHQYWTRAIGRPMVRGGRVDVVGWAATPASPSCHFISACRHHIPPSRRRQARLKPSHLGRVARRLHGERLPPSD